MRVRASRYVTGQCSCCWRRLRSKMTRTVELLLEKGFFISYENYSLVDCDGHIVESIPELAEFMSDRIKGHALKPNRTARECFRRSSGRQRAQVFNL